MKKKLNSSAQQKSMESWDRLFNDAFTTIISDKVISGEPVKLSEEEHMLLDLLHYKRIETFCSQKDNSEN